jgi:predicted AAA+ superfamily ATPase
MDLDKLVKPFSPWLASNPRVWQDRQAAIPAFHRPLFDAIVEDLQSLKQMLSITGPRRVGKSTILLQIVQHLLNVQKVAPARIIYYSLDDPALLGQKAGDEDVIEALMTRLSDLGSDGPCFLFLDEIQTYERWEQHLKKYYDLQYPVKVVISGSASSPIFKKSRESLLGRVKDFHLLPFSFREFLRYSITNQRLQEEIDSIAKVGRDIVGKLTRNPADQKTEPHKFGPLSNELWQEAQRAFNTYVVDGGFPEVWTMNSATRKMEYLYDNQVKKVITEDLVLAVEFRKPELLKRFYISLLEQPGREVNLTQLSKEVGINVQQIEKYLPLLEMTDLIRSVGNFRNSAMRVRRGNQKYYLVDVGLRNAVLRIGPELLKDDTVMGLYAENLVFNAIKKWPGVLQIDYFREGQKEVDFVVHTRPSHYVPLEVKYRNKWSDKDLSGIVQFREKFKKKCAAPIVVTKKREHFILHEDGLLMIPLLHFLLLFD